MKRAILALIAACAEVPAAAPPASGPLYKVAAVKFDLRVDDVVGGKRSGSLCLPAGSIAWREAKPDRLDAREAVTLAARSVGLNVGAADNPFEQGVTGVDRAIRVRVRGLRLTACVPPSGLGRLVSRSRVVKGEGLIAIEWRIFARGQDNPVMTARTCSAFTYRGDPGGLQEMALAGIGAATARFASEVKAGAKGPITIEDEGCLRLRLSDTFSSDDDRDD